MGIKNAEFDADFESVEKVAKSCQRKSDRKMEFLTFITVCKSFRPIPYNFFWINCFPFFSTDLYSASNFAFFGNHIKFLLKDFLY